MGGFDPKRGSSRGNVDHDESTQIAGSSSFGAPSDVGGPTALGGPSELGGPTPLAHISEIGGPTALGGPSDLGGPTARHTGSDDLGGSTARGQGALDDMTPFVPGARSAGPGVRASAPPSVSDTLAPGTLLGDYVLEAKLGSGAMGDVYLGVHHMIRKRAAIKLLRGEACKDPGMIERFIAEARVVNEIGHPNIVDIFAFGQARDGRHFLAMECLEGETLGARLQRGPLPVAQAIEIARPLTRALLAAHAKGVVHRDLKPDNVFLHTVQGSPTTVKLLDFGIAKLERAEMASKTATGATIGTPLYMSPEQAQGLPVDGSTDTYALGGILFEMLTGRPPFEAATIFEVISMHIHDVPPHASQFAHVPLDLDDLIAAMLAKDATRRPPLADVLAFLDRFDDPNRRPAVDSNALREQMVSIAYTTPATGSRSSTAAPRPTRRRLGAAIAALLVVGCAGLAFGIYHLRSTTTTRAEHGLAPPSVPPSAEPSTTPAPPAAAAAASPATEAAAAATTMSADGSGASVTTTTDGSGATTTNAAGSGTTATTNAAGSGATATTNAAGSGATAATNAAGSGAPGTATAAGSGSPDPTPRPDGSEPSPTTAQPAATARTSTRTSAPKGHKTGRKTGAAAKAGTGAKKPCDPFTSIDGC